MFPNEVSNKQAVENFSRRQELECEVRYLNNQMTDLREQLRVVEERFNNTSHELSKVKQTTSIYEGVAISVDSYRQCYGLETHIDPVGDDVPRRAKVYPNANNKGKFGLYFYEETDDIHTNRNEYWQGSDFARRRAIKLAKDWVALGVERLAK